MKEPKDTLDILISELDAKQPKHSIWYYMLNGELIKQKKPCIEGSRVHLHRWDGVYTVHRATVSSFRVRKNGEYVDLPWSEFRCLYGMGTSFEANLKRDLRKLNKSSHNMLMTALKVDRLTDNMIRQIRNHYEP